MPCHACRNFPVGIPSVGTAVKSQPRLLLHIPFQGSDNLRRNIRRIGDHYVKLCLARHPRPDIRLEEPGPVRYSQQFCVFLGYSQGIRRNVHRQSPASRQQLQQGKQNSPAAGSDIQNINSPTGGFNRWGYLFSVRQSLWFFLFRIISRSRNFLFVRLPKNQSGPFRSLQGHRFPIRHLLLPGNGFFGIRFILQLFCRQGLHLIHRCPGLFRLFPPEGFLFQLGQAFSRYKMNCLFHQQFRFRPGDQDSRGHVKLPLQKSFMPCNIGQGLPGRTAQHKAPVLFQFFRGKLLLEPHKQIDTAAAQHVTKQYFRIQAWGFQALSRKVLLCPLQYFIYSPYGLLRHLISPAAIFLPDLPSPAHPAVPTDPRSPQRPAYGG